MDKVAAQTLEDEYDFRFHIIYHGAPSVALRLLERARVIPTDLVIGSAVRILHDTHVVEDHPQGVNVMGTMELLWFPLFRVVTTYR